MSCGCNGHSVPNYTAASPYDGHNYPVAYNLGGVSAGDIITSGKWVEIRNYITTERARRGAGAVSDTGLSGTIEANDLNNLTSHINYHWSDGYVGATATITATNVNYVVDKLNYCGTVCICNCNYCTCNCNYCTCNCNYACTCNCNY
mgnify:FL=1